MQIFLKYGLGETIALDVDPTMNFEELKLRISEISGISIDSLSINCGFLSLEGVDTLEEAGINEYSTIHFSELTFGGAKKKKKNFTKPKKIKHKKKKVKLAVLKYYKVDGDKVVKLRRECPADTCGAGVFMAQHFNRTSCGRCGLTFFPTKSDDGKK
ncbi:ribosomal protein S27a [Cryptosporidium ryanae]|uniref:ribosomal protein S27a n=1 Tax=Cryptosporidium ryanae TaxID=515981 RepID=UPI00351A61A3|nr:ribosomal protein S27a [Cryptosporidium ryanae]